VIQQKLLFLTDSHCDGPILLHVEMAPAFVAIGLLALFGSRWSLPSPMSKITFATGKRTYATPIKFEVDSFRFHRLGLSRHRVCARSRNIARRFMEDH
jgi:hypothetical protein